MKAILFFIFLSFTFFLSAQTPVAYYPFNGNANDAAGTLNGTVNGAILTPDRFGNANSAYSFDGIDDVISFSGIPMSNTDNFTIMAWVNPALFDPANQFNKMIISLGPGSNGYNLGMGNGSGSGAGNQLSALYNLVAWINSGTFFPTINTWYHVALVRDNGTTKFYFNGTQSPNTTTASPNSFSSGFQIGGQGFDPTHYWNGKIDEVKIYNVALTPSQVQAEYTQTAGPVAYYPFSGNANDIVGNNNGTVNGAALTADRFGNVNKAYHFDGVDDYIAVGGINFATNNYTISFWMNGNSNTSDHNIFSGADPADITKTFVAVEYNSGSIRFLHRNPSGGAGGVEINTPVSINQWHFITCVKENTTLNIYLDGTLVNSITDGSITNIAAAPFIEFGRLRAITNSIIRHYNGSLDEMKIYNIALTALQIQHEYGLSNQAQKPGSGNAISFDGFDDVVEVTHNAALNFPGDLTVESWIKIPATQNNTANNDNAIIEKWAGNNSGIGYPFTIRFIKSTHSVSFARYNGTASVGVDGIAVVDDNKWHHIAATKTGNALSLYIDGILQGTGADLADVTNVNNTQNLNIGSRGPLATGPNQLTGTIDEIRIWNAGLTQSEIRDRMCHKIIPSDVLYSNLIAYYNFDESSGNTVFDGSINANNGAMTNNPTRVTSGAAIGNFSTHNYVTGGLPATNLTVNGEDNLAIAYTAGTFNGEAGTHIYAVDEVPNTTNGINGAGTNDRYFGVFNANLTAPAYTATYNYTGNSFVTAGNENMLALYKRADNAATIWNNASAVLNTTANTLTATGQNTEYMLGTLAVGNISLSGALTGEYATLKDAFDAINIGGSSGSIIVTVNNNTTETVQATLNETSYAIQVVPIGNRTIEGNLNSPLILLNGADNVTFNGQTLTGANTLTLRNTSATTASVIKLLDAASNNTIRKCIIEANSNGAGVTQGALVINTTTIGNSVGNIIDSNIVRRASASGVNIGIILSGTSASATSTINNTQITNNSIENVFINNVSSFGITVQNNCINTLIKGNSVYATVPVTNTLNGMSYAAISVSARSTVLGSGAIIDSNFVGGSAPGCGGSKMVISSPNNNFSSFMIIVSDNNFGNSTSVTRNTINNLDINVGNPGATTVNPLSAITIQIAKLQAFNNNTVGSISNSAITINMKPSSTGAIGCFGMLIQSSCATPIANNFVGGIEISSSSSGGSTVGPFFVALDTRNAVSYNIKNNIIGSTSGGNIFVSNTATGVFNLQLIANSGALDAAIFNIDSNTVRSVNASHASVAGINYSNSNIAATTVTTIIAGNSITDLTVTDASSVINGISYTTVAGVTNLTHTLTVKNNLVNNLLGIFGSSNSLRGINITNSSTAVNRIKGRIENNTVTNFTNIASTTTGVSRAITLNNDIVTGDSMVLAGNSINNIIDDGTTVLTDPSLSSFGNSSGIVVLLPNSPTNGTAVVRDNDIHSIITSSASNAPTKVHAISVFGNAAIIERNKIYDLRNAATSATASLAPILLRSRPDDANTAVIRNNMIAVNTTTAAQMAGIKTMDGTVKANIYHNSILLEGNSNANSFALLKDATTAVIDVKNNVLYNAVTGIGTAFAIGVAGNTSGYTGNNNYFVSTAVNALCQVDIVSHTLASWQAAATQDAATQQGQAAVNTSASNLFINKATGNLLINTANATEPVKLSNNGLALSASVPFDFMNVVRDVNTPDIGAHEFIFTGPLPLTLLSFSGTKEHNDAKLQWITANEINVKRYEVQRSDNGRDFVTIGTATSGNSLYSFVDANVFVNKSLAYYRLKSIDNDGRFTYSNIIRLSNQAAAVVSIFPNPVKDVVTIGGLKQEGTICLFDATGKLLQQQNVKAQTITLDMTGYAKGMYLLQYRVKAEVTSQKIIKE
jgi:hypothetical protein